MINLAFIGNGKSANRYHLPFVLKLQDKFCVKTMFSRHMKDDWETNRRCTLYNEYQ